MMDVLELLDKLNEWRRQWRARRDSLQANTLQLAVESCQALVRVEDVRSDTGILLHERVKSLYDGAPRILNGSLQPPDLEAVMDALASARIYYWIRFLKGQSTDELDLLIRRRLKLYGSLPSSLNALALALQAVSPNENVADDRNLTDESLAALRRGCLADFAKLQAVVARYGAV